MRGQTGKGSVIVGMVNMNTFQLDKTLIMKSELDFTRAYNSRPFSGSANISDATATPKDPDKHPNVICTAILDLGGSDESLSIHVETRSLFKITNVENKSALRADAEKFCRDIALKELSRVIGELTKLHTGNSMSIPIPLDVDSE